MTRTRPINGLIRFVALLAAVAITAPLVLILVYAIERLGYYQSMAAYSAIGFSVAAALACAAIGHRRWVASVLMLLGAGWCAWGFLHAALPNPERDKRLYGEFLQMPLPDDAYDLSWERRSDYRGTIRVHAPAASLRELSKAPLFRKHPWRAIPRGRFKVKFDQPGFGEAEGRIEPELGFLSVRYSLW